jgi:hypothetical protein
VEQEAVNFEVAGSSPVPGAIQKPFGLFSRQKDGLVVASLQSSPVPGATNKK